MEANKQLSIVIPTYNRADFLDYSLEVHIPILEKCNIQIFVSDNDSTDNTSEIVKKWMKKYPFLKYHKNEINIGPDANFEKALKLPNTDYVWLLGDTMEFSLLTLERLIKNTEKNIYEMIIINDNSRVGDITQVFEDHNSLLNCLGWHMTQMSSLIYSKRILSKANFQRYAKTNFIQTGIIFEGLSKYDNFKVKWIQEISVIGLKKSGLVKKSWESVTFEIWMKNWINFIFSLPSIYSLDIKITTIRKHNDFTGLFSIKNLLKLKYYGYYELKDFYEYKVYFQIALNNSTSINFLIPFIIPNLMIKLMIKLKKNAK